jgi:hypothetical protein
VSVEDVRDVARVVLDPARMALIAQGGDETRLRAAIVRFPARRSRR